MDQYIISDHFIRYNKNFESSPPKLKEVKINVLGEELTTFLGKIDAYYVIEIEDIFYNDNFDKGAFLSRFLCKAVVDENGNPIYENIRDLSSDALPFLKELFNQLAPYYDLNIRFEHTPKLYPMTENLEDTHVQASEIPDSSPAIEVDEVS